jgi:hypothetical protein
MGITEFIGETAPTSWISHLSNMTFATCHLWLGILLPFFYRSLACAKNLFQKERGQNMLYGLRYELTASDLHELEIVKEHMWAMGEVRVAGWGR